MPRPRISSIPASAGAGRTSNRPAQASTWARSSATSRVKGRALCSRSQTSRDLPKPAGPRINAALGPISTAEAWMVAVSAAITSPAAAPRNARRARAALVPLGRRRRRWCGFDPDAAAMSFDDLLGDRQAKTGILPEALLRAVGVEALEYLIQGFRADAGAV